MGEIIRKPNIIEKIFKTKAEKLEISYQKYKPYQITNQLIDDKLEDFMKNDPPIIKPLLINNVITEVFSRLFLIVFLKDTAETRIKLDQIKVYFPRILIIQIEDLHTKRKFIYLHGYFPNIKEKEMLISILVNTFKDDLIILKRSFLTRKVFLLKSFYDFQNKRFFYTKDLFDQYFLYCQKIFGREITSLQEIQGINQEAFWSKEKEMSNLINEIDHNLLKSNIDLNINKLNKLITFNSNLREILLDREKFKDEKLKYFFKNYVKSIKFIPKFQQFGIGQYFMYIYPNNLNEIDLTLLLSNSFQKVKYPASIDNSTSLFIRYLWPYRNPNLTYVRWLTKSKKNIREYCLFFIKKIKTILNINYNLSLNNWVYDPNKFKIFMQNILFNPIYKIQISKTKEFNIGNLVNSDYRGPESDDFINLIKIYNWHSIDIKSYLLTKKLTIINPIVDLLEENLIFPYISLKNLDLIEKIYIILPNLKQDLNNKIQQIFSFFNFGFIYEIEGEYFIYGMPEEIKFEDGLMIELSLPDCDLNGFIKLFELLFHYLEIEHYLILYDLLDGKNLLESIYGNLNFLKDYNPLKNLRWNSKDKIWMNNKLFNEKFEPIYHDLIPEEKD